MLSASRKESLISPTTILYQDRATSISRAETTEEDLWLSLPDLASSTGWELKPEGVCHDEICIPIPADKSYALLREEGGESLFNFAEFARFLKQAYAHDATHNVWSFVAPAEEWRSQLSTPMAPDFNLPDLDGNLHSLSDFRGKKVFLLCWASW